MKKGIVIAAALATALVLVACSSGSGSSSASSASASSSSASSASASSSLASSAQSTASSATAGLANPWSDVATAEEAAKGAGLSSFVLPAVGTKLSVGPIGEWTYRCMEGIAQAEADAGVLHLTIRKGAKVETGDISGDYNVYKFTWVKDVYGIEVSCAGNAEGQAQKITWTANDFDFSITVQGQGDDSESFGLGEEDVVVLVSGTN